MKHKKLILLLLVLLLLPFTLKLRGEDFGQHQSLFTDIKAHAIGDILTVNIVEENRASNQVSSKTEKTTKSSIDSAPGIGELAFIPMLGADIKTKNSFDGKGDNIRNASLRARMSVTVINIKPNGDLIIQGSRTIGISKDKETIVLTGVVRQKDIAPNNTINSYQIADAEIHYTGKGNASTAARPGFLSRFLGWLF